MTDLLDDNTPAEPSVAPPKKRSLFSAAAKQRLTEADAAVEFFSRAKELYPQRLAEEERKRQKKLVKLERKRSSASADLRETTPTESKKRRRSSQKDACEGYSSDSAAEREQDEEGQWNRRASSISTPSSQRRESQQSSSRNKSHACPTSLSARYNKDLKAEKRKSPKKDHAPKGYISLTDSDEAGKTALPVREPTNQPISLDEDDDIEVISGSVRRRGSPPVDEDDLQLSEEEFPELIAAAKERERQRLLQKEKAARSFSERNHGSKRDDLDDIFDSGVETPVEDPVVEILITSKMEGTSQLRVRRKFSQPFKPVRLSWCDKQMTTDGQPFEQALKDEIFLTWKSHKLYDNTTCESLGLTVDSSGKLSGDGIDQHGRLHMEAWTADALEYYKKRKAAKEKKEQGGSDDEAAAREARKEAIPKTKLILKAKDMEDVKLTVKAATTVEKMIGGFRSIRELPEDKHITIHMDGDELGLSTTVGELELEDMDILDVHVR